MVTGEKVLKAGRRAALERGEPIIIVLEEDEFVDEYEVIVTGWKRRDEAERATPGRPVKAVLHPDEYIDEGGRLRVRKPREILPPAARVALQPDEYIDEKGVVRTDRAVRKRLEAAPSIDFADVVVEEKMETALSSPSASHSLIISDTLEESGRICEQEGQQVGTTLILYSLS